MGNLANDVLPSSDNLPAAAGVTLAELLTLPGLASAQLLAGSAGLGRVVRCMNVMEVPDIVPWVKPHELLLTTGYPLRDTPQAWAGLLADLDDAGVTALGVKLHRYVDELPADMLEAANARGFPLVALPENCAFDDVLTEVLTHILARQSGMLERSEEAHRALVGVVLDGGGLTELMGEVSRMLEGPSLVTTSDGRILASAGDADLLASLFDTVAFDPSGRFRVEKFLHGLHDIDGLSAVVVRVVAGRHDHGRLVVFSPTQRYGSGEVNVVERAATVAALVITKSQAVQVVESKYRGDFVRDVLMQRAGDSEAVAAHFSSLGWDVQRPLVAVVAAIDQEQPRSLAPVDVRTAQERFNTAWINVVGRADPSAPAVGFSSEVVVLMPVSAKSDPRSVVGPLVRSVSGDGGGGRRTFGTGISRVITNPADIPAAYEQARRAVRVGRQLQGLSAISLFDDLGAFRLLSLIEDATELRTFVVEALGELADEHDVEAADMRTTLRALLDTNLNVAETARRLHFHYNTLRYRISKLERIVGPFTSDADLRLDLALALRVMQMRGL